jgi:hypothetical protein
MTEEPNKITETADLYVEVKLGTRRAKNFTQHQIDDLMVLSRAKLCTEMD